MSSSKNIISNTSPQDSKASGWIGRFLGPSADYLGIELRDWIKEKIQKKKQEKSKQQNENLCSHINVVNELNDKSGLSIFPQLDDIESLNQLTIVADCFENMQDVSPDDKALSNLWRALLTKVIIGKTRSQRLLELLKQINSEEADLFYTFRNGKNRLAPRNDYGRYYLKNLKKLGLIEINFIIPIVINLFIFLTIPIIQSFYNNFPSSIVFVNLIITCLFFLTPLYKASWIGQELLSYTNLISKNIQDKME